MEEKYKYHLYNKIVILLILLVFNLIFNNNACYKNKSNIIKNPADNSLNNNKSIDFNNISNNTQIFKVELIKSNSHILKLLIPSEKCSSSYPTVYLTSKYREINKSEVIIDEPNNPKQKNYLIYGMIFSLDIFEYIFKAIYLL